MAKLVKLVMESELHQTIRAPDTYKPMDTLIDADSPSKWLVIPTEKGGVFCTRAGLVISMAVEDEEAINGSA